MSTTPRVTAREYDTYYTKELVHIKKLLVDACHDRDKWIKYHDAVAADYKKWRLEAQSLFDENQKLKEQLSAAITQNKQIEDAAKLVTSLLVRDSDKLEKSNKELREALEIVADWTHHREYDAFYEYNYGSNGVRDFYKAIAREALDKQ